MPNTMQRVCAIIVTTSMEEAATLPNVHTQIGWSTSGESAKIVISTIITKTRGE